MAWELLTESDKGYIAGFFDGEGSVSFSTNGEKIYPRVCFYNTNKSVIDWIAEVFDEITVKRSVDKRRDSLHNLDNYAVYVKKTKYVKFVLECMLPYLRIKRNQAIQTIDFLEWKLERMWKTRSKEELKIEKEHKMIIQKLNKGDRD